ncbi:MAG: molybdate ABC transporter substrate-binding protein [Actinomycetota bacterium]
MAGGRRRQPDRARRPAVAGVLALGIVAGVALTGCASHDREVLDVYAAASLTDAFTAFEAAFEADNPDVDVRLNLAGSTTLQRQILDGADADVFAPADVALLAAVSDTAADDGEPEVYATNSLTLILPGDGGDTDVEGLSAEEAVLDGAVVGPGALVARCAAGVPCGDATDDYLARAGLDLGAVTEEPNVRAVLRKVAGGEADAGFVYVTDAATDDRVIALDLAAAPTVDYALAVLSDEPTADAFARYVHSPEAAEALRRLGFDVP